MNMPDRTTTPPKGTVQKKIKPEEIKWDNLPDMQLDSKSMTEVRNWILNQEPPKQWIKKLQFANNAEYLPIDKVEYLLTSLFKSWRVEIKEHSLIANAMVCVVRLYYLNPDTKQYDWQDGIGASALKVKSGTQNPNDTTKMLPNAVEIAAPISETSAVKDAADKIGRLFGRDLNRKNTVDYTNKNFKNLLDE